MAGHGRGRIIEYNQHNIISIVYCIYHSGYTGRKKCGISDKSKIYRVRLDHVKSLGDGHSRAHTQAGIHHIKRLCISQGIASDVTAEYRFFTLHGLFHGIEGSPVGTSGTEHRRTHGKFRSI